MQRYIFRTLKRNCGTFAHPGNMLHEFVCSAHTALDAFKLYCACPAIQKFSEEEVGAVVVVMLPCVN